MQANYCTPTTDNRARDTLRQAQLKITRPRLLVLNIFYTSETRHLSADDIYRCLPEKNGQDIALPTIYRVLTDFEEKNLVSKLKFDTHSIYELSDHQHDHLVCMSCRQVLEFNDPITIQQQQQIALNKQFDLSHYELTLFGTCHACQAEQKKTD